ncbi:MAG TPA: hypothetical protein VGL13_05660 [Polyangiaceae bacterium]
MPQPNRPPAAIRLVRPYASEKEFVEGDFAYLGRATLFLPSVASKPAGEVVRFEFVLSTGAPVFRGEAQTVAHHVATASRPEGLEVRITRMDAKSKAILDHVKERRAAGQRTSPKSLMPTKGAESIAPSKAASIAPSKAQSIAPAKSLSITPAKGAVEVTDVAAVAGPPGKDPDPVSERASETSGIHLRPVRMKIAPPPNREEILERLRERARQLAAKGALPLKRAKQSA